MIVSAKIMKVIDMTNLDILPSNTTLPVRSAKKGSPNKNAIRLELLDFDAIEDERAIVPKMLIAYHKFAITQRDEKLMGKSEKKDYYDGTEDAPLTL